MHILLVEISLILSLIWQRGFMQWRKSSSWSYLHQCMTGNNIAILVLILSSLYMVFTNNLILIRSKQNWSQVNKTGPNWANWSQVSKTDTKWAKLVPSEQNWSQVSKTGPKWTQLVPSEQNWSQISKTGPKGTKLVQRPLILYSLYCLNNRTLVYISELEF